MILVKKPDSLANSLEPDKEDLRVTLPGFGVQFAIVFHTTCSQELIFSACLTDLNKKVKSHCTCTFSLFSADH